MSADGAYPVFGANGVIGRYHLYNHEEPQLLITCRGATCGSVNLSLPRSWITGNAMVVRPKDSSLSLRFLEYLFRGGIDLSSAITGAAQPQITRTNLAPLKISYPSSITEQDRIVSILDEAVEGIGTAKANAEKNLRNAHAIFNSYLQSMFTQGREGWLRKRLDEVGATQTGSTPTATASNFGDFIPFVKPADFKSDGSLDYDNDGLSEVGASQARKVTSGSVLMVCIGATIGKSGHCDRDIATNQQINALTPFPNVSGKFLYYQWLTESFQQQVLQSSSQATLPIINKSKWNALKVTIAPTLEEQLRIANRCESLSDNVQRLKNIFRQKLLALDALRDSLLNQAFARDL